MAHRVATEEATTSLRLNVEIVYDPGCPNVPRAREVLTRALQEAGMPALWTEWNTGEASCPDDRRAYGSPTILVNGADVAPGPHPWAQRDHAEGPRCRVYAQGDGRLAGAPPLDRVLEAIQEAVAPDAG